MSEIILEMDAKFDEDGPEGFDEYVEGEVDTSSIMYIAVQRALRLRGRSIGSIAAIYTEAFIVGRRFERRYGIVKRYGSLNSDEPKDGTENPDE